MKLMKQLLALLLALAALMSIPVFAEGDSETAGLVQQDPLLDAAFSMLEEGNPFLVAYNNITGAGVEPHFTYGLPYFFGGTYDYKVKGEQLLFSREPEYAKRDCWEQTKFYDKGKWYLYGLDCSGYTRWIYHEVGWPKHDTLSGMINQYGKYAKKNHVYSHRPGKEMPPYEDLASTLELGDLLVVAQGGRPPRDDVHRHPARLRFHRGDCARAGGLPRLHPGHPLWPQPDVRPPDAEVSGRARG